MIGDYLTEINVTSPTGIREVKRFGGADIAAAIIDESRPAGLGLLHHYPLRLHALQVGSETK